MNKYLIFLKKFSRPTMIGVIVLILSVSLIVITSSILYRQTLNILTQNLRDRLLTISITQAANIDAKDVDALQVQEDWLKPEWARIVNKLHKTKYDNKDIVFMYIFRYTKDESDDPIEMEFVADADSIDPYANMTADPLRNVDVNRDGLIEADGPDKLQWPGQPYPEVVDIPEAYEAYNAPITVKDLYTDNYGTVLTGYAPIKDENGNTVAILATDIKADDFFTITKQTLVPFLIFITLLSIIISILILVIIYFWKKYDKFLQDTNEKLTEAVKKETEQRKNIEHLLKIKEEFIDLVSHQLRTPVSVMKGMASMLKDGDLDNAPKEKRDDFIRGIYEKSNKLAEILDDMLKAAEVDIDNFSFAPGTTVSTNLSSLIKSVFDDLASLAQQKKLNYTFKANPEVSNLNIMTDIMYLKNAFQNIIDNAIKYSKEGGSVTVEFENKDNFIICKIADSGIGIADDQKDKLFEKFVRASNAVDLYAYGTGLGLFFAKKIFQAHIGGDIWFDSVLNKGTTFYIKLPIAK